MTAVGPSPSLPPEAGVARVPVATPPGPAPAWTVDDAPRAHAWIRPAVVGLGAAAATVYTALVNPNTSHAFPLCPLRVITGYDCPMCGGLRAVHSLAHGDLIGAADHNVALVLAVPFIVLAYLAWLGRSVGLRIPEVHVSRRVVAGLVIAMIVFGIVRNLPVPGYAFLNSTAHLAGRSS